MSDPYTALQRHYDEVCDQLMEALEENRKLKEEILDLREKIDAYEWAMGI